MSSTELSLESQISDKKQGTESPVKIFSVRNIAIGLTVFVLAVSCIVTYAYKDQIFGSSKSVESFVKITRSSVNVDGELNNLTKEKNEENKENEKKTGKIGIIEAEKGEIKKENEIKEENEKKEIKKENKIKKEEKIIKKEHENGNKTIDHEQQNEQDDTGENAEKFKNNFQNDEDDTGEYAEEFKNNFQSDEEEVKNNEEELKSGKEIENNDPITGGNIFFMKESLSIFSLFSFSQDDRSQKIVVKNIGDFNFFIKPSSFSFDYNKFVYMETIEVWDSFSCEIKSIKNICIRNFNSENESDVIVETNENIIDNNGISPCFNPDGTKILYAVKNENGTQDILSKDLSLNPNNPEIFKTFDENSLLKFFKYSTDGTIFVALILNLEGPRKYIFNVYDQNNNQSLKTFEIYEVFFLKDYQSDTVCPGTGITNFSISQDNSKIAFTYEIEIQEIISAESSTYRKIYVIDLTAAGTGILEPKQIYGPKNLHQSYGLFKSLHWSPNGENIIFNEIEGNCVRIMVIKINDSLEDGVKTLKYEEGNPMETFKNEEGNPMEVLCIGWSK